VEGGFRTGEEGEAACSRVMNEGMYSIIKN